MWLELQPEPDGWNKDWGKNGDDSELQTACKDMTRLIGCLPWGTQSHACTCPPLGSGPFQYLNFGLNDIWWSYETFSLPIVHWAHDPTVFSSVAIRKGPRRFCPHRSDCCHALMLTCRNSHLWQHCEHCNVLSLFWPPWLDQLNSVCITWHVLIQTNRKLATYNHMNSLALWTTIEYELVDANRGIQKVRVGHVTRSGVATCHNIILLLLLLWTQDMNSTTLTHYMHE